jgi:hypothetical protein
LRLAPKPTIPLGRHSRKRQNRADMGRSKPMNAPQNPAAWQLFTNNPTD